AGGVWMRFCASANRSSLVQTTAPPRSRNARSGIEVKCGRVAGAFGGGIGVTTPDPIGEAGSRTSCENERTAGEWSPAVRVVSRSASAARGLVGLFGVLLEALDGRLRDLL